MSMEVLGGRYRILETIGEGGMAVVYKARDTLLGRVVAIKVLHPQYAQDDEFVERFREEARAAASLLHPNVVNVYDVGRDDGRDYIVMEYVPGESLKSIIRRQGRLSVATATRYVMHILEALAHAHESGIIHRDIKPHNILITIDGRAKVADFGIARAASSSGLTETGTVLGTVAYISPEQARGAQVDQRSDLYSLGVVYYEALTGRVPFSGDTSVSVALKHIQEIPEPPSLYNPAIPRAIEKVIMKALQKDPAKRFATAKEMLSALSAAAKSLPSEPPMTASVGGRRDTSARSSRAQQDGVQESTRVMNPKEIVGVQDKLPGRTDYEGDEDMSRSRRGSGRIRLALILLVIATVGVLLGAWGIQSFLGWINTGEVAVPDFTGKTVADAEIIARQNKLRLDTSVSRYSDTVPEGHVMSQSPAPGTKRKVWSTVILTVSLGKDLAEVPDLYGKSVREAEIALDDAGLSVGEIAQDYHPDVPAGRIISQSPEAGAKAETGSQVSLVVSQGPPPASIQVPQLVGLDEESAKAAIAASGLSAGEIKAQPTSSAPAGTVLAQNPPAGTEVEPGAAVDLLVAASASSSQMGSSGALGNAGGVTETGSSELASPRQFSVRYKVEEGPEWQEVKVVVKDYYGERVEYGPTLHRAGEFLEIKVTVYGRGTIEVWVDGQRITSEQV